MNARKPDTILIAVTRADGGLTMLRLITAEYEPDGKGGRQKRWEVEPTPDYIDGIIAKHEWTGDLAPVSWRIVPDNFITARTDRTFRDAWTDAGNGSPDVDMPKAREVHRNRLRKQRGPLFDQLDAEYLRADEAGDTEAKQRIVAQKQKLRDAPADPRIEAADTPAKLKRIRL
jgi:hypothetical protein